MAVNTVDYRGNLGAANTDRLPSRNVWADCPVQDIKEGTVPGLYFYDDFVDFPLTGTQTTQIGFGKYKVFATTGSSVTKVEAVNSVEITGGVLSLTTDTDNDSASIAQAYPAFRMSGDPAIDGKLWFECCYAQNSIVTNLAGTMILLAETELWTLATGVPFNGGDAITNGASGIGFRLAEDGLGVIDTVVTDRATSFTNIGAGEGGTLAANTFAKLGFVYDPSADPTRRIVFYLNNLEVTTKYTQTNLAATTNLKANNLGLIFASVADSAGTTFANYMKWWRVAQILPN